MTNSVLRKRLLYRSWYRGCKETDIILGYFAKHELHNLDEQELVDYQNLLEENDADLVAWITKQAPIPEHINVALVNKIVEYHQSNAKV